MSQSAHSCVIGILRRVPKSDRRYNGRQNCAELLEPRRLLAAIASGQTVQATIGVIGEADDYTFTANAGDAIVAGISRNESSIQPRLRILAPGGGALFDQGATFGLDHVLTAPDTGTYTFRVTDTGDDQTGGYAVSLAKLPGPQTSDGDDGPLTSGQAYLGNLSLGDLDVFTFSANSGDAITMGLSRFNSVVEVTLDVFDSAGANLFSEASTFGLDADFTVPNTGTFYAVVRDANCDEAGQYRFSFARPVTPTTATMLGSGRWERGNVDFGQFKLYTFQVPLAGADVRIGASRLNSTIEPRVTVYNASGQQVSTGNSSFGFDLDFTAVTAGQYVAVVGDASSDEAGDFGLTVAVGGAVPALERGPLVSGRQYRGTLEVGMLQTFSFSGTAGDNVTFAASRINSAIEVRIDIFRPDGVKLASDVSVFGFDTEVTLPSTGTYLAVLADGAADEGGGLAFSFARGSGPQNVGPLLGDAEGGSIQSGQRRDGFLDPGDLDVFTLAADAGDNIFVSMSRNSAIEPRINLYGPDGALLETQITNFGAFVEVVAPSAGTYTAILRDGDADEAGAYTMSLAIGPQAIAADPIDNDGGTLSAATTSGYLTLADTDIYTFNATAGVPFTVRMLRQNSSAIEPSLTIYGPNGARFSDAGTFEAIVTVANPPVSGTYTAVAAEGSVDEAGGYGIALSAAPPSTTDTRAPQALLGSLEYLRSGNVQIQFNEAMQGLTAAALTLNNVTMGAIVPVSAVTFDAGLGIATYSAMGGLPDGNYTATLAVGTARDLANNALAIGINFSFFVLRGDANRDRTVGIADFGILASNFNQIGTFGEGDFNYSGVVEIGDFALLGSRFNTNLPARTHPALGALTPKWTTFSERLVDDVL